MANLNELYPKNNWAADGPLGGFLAGMQLPYAFKQADDDQETTRLKQQAMGLANKFDEYDMPSKMAGSDAAMAKAQMNSRLINTGLPEESQISSMKTGMEEDKGKQSKARQEMSEEKRQDIMEWSGFFKNVPDGAMMTEPVQAKWKEWQAHMNKKWGMKVPPMYDPEAKKVLGYYETSAMASPKFEQQKFITDQAQDAKQKVTETNVEGAYARAQLAAQGRIQTAQIAAEAAASKITDKFVLEQAKREAKLVEQRNSAELLAAGSTIEATRAAHSTDPVVRADAQRKVEQERANITARNMEKIQDIFERAAGAKSTATSTGGAPDSNVVARDLSKQKVLMDSAPTYSKGMKLEDGGYYKHPSTGQTLMWDASSKKMIVVTGEMK